MDTQERIDSIEIPGLHTQPWDELSSAQKIVELYPRMMRLHWWPGIVDIRFTDGTTDQWSEMRCKYEKNL